MSASEEEATDFIVDLLRNGRDLLKYGHTIFLPAAIQEYLHAVGRIPRTQTPASHWVNHLSPVFLTAAWTLCRLGVLRPGVEQLGTQCVGDNEGYALTAFGKQWISESTDRVLIPSDSERTTKMLLAAGKHFGDAYALRAQDAARCYMAHAFLACCAMVGGAAEAILLAAGSLRLGEAQALATYKSGSGRGRLQSQLLAGRPDWMKREFDSHTGLISYWRDQSAHGHSSTISESEAFTAIRGLLRFAHFADDNWNELTAP